MKRLAIVAVLTAALPALAQVANEPTISAGAALDALAGAGIARVFPAKQAHGANPVARNPAGMEKAARAGDAESAYELGKVYEYGLLGATVDESRATEWYRAAAELGHRAAQFEASVAYYKGHGVTPDRIEAAKWWTLAMMQGGQYAEAIRPSVESAEAKLTPDEVAEGRRRAMEWAPRR